MAETAEEAEMRELEEGVARLNDAGAPLLEAEDAQSELELILDLRHFKDLVVPARAPRDVRSAARQVQMAHGARPIPAHRRVGEHGDEEVHEDLEGQSGHGSSQMAAVSGRCVDAV